IGETVKAAFDAIVGAVQAVFSIDLSKTGEQILRSLWQGMLGVKDWLVSQVTGLMNDMLQPFSDAVDWIGKQFSFSAGAGTPAPAGGMAPQRGFAALKPRGTGGPVRAGEVAMVGERGPELVRFGASGYVTPNDMLASSSAMPGVFRALVSGLHDLTDVLRK